MLGTRTVLLLLLLGIMVSFLVISLLIVGARLRQQVRTDSFNDLNRSLFVFENAETERLQELAKEGRLLADLPSLKALLTTSDDRTIADGSLEFWSTSGNDLFALTDASRRVRTVFIRGLSAGHVFRADISRTLVTGDRPYLISEGHLLHLISAPVYFGSSASGTLLGYVVTGDLIDTEYQTNLSTNAGANAMFLSNGVVLASSIALAPSSLGNALTISQPHFTEVLTVGGQRNLAVSRDLSKQANRSLALVFLKSLQGPDQEIRDISRLLLLTGIAILMVGSWMMVLVASRLTRPLEKLADEVRSFGSDHKVISSPPQGTREVRQLAGDFAAMQERVESSSRALLESERLATIGSMANSVSHDLRHYMASIYANAEFLAAPDMTEAERSESFEDIRMAVAGTTDMLESLLIFSRTGQSALHLPERLDELAQRAIDQIRTHPVAGEVTFSLVNCTSPTSVSANGSQLERAIYNILLNACQSAVKDSGYPIVTVEIVPGESEIAARVTDNGKGISPAFSDAIFDPFVSQGKQNGTGLGLTLCRRIAEEHGGRVQLVRSVPGETVFELTLPLLANEPSHPFDPLTEANGR